VAAISLEMKNNDAFSGLHPVVNFVYFAAVLLLTMFFMHPVCLLIAFTGAVTYAAVLFGMRKLKQALFLLPVMLVTVAISVAFNHRGVTVLAYLSNGNPLTLESAVYGVTAAVLLAAVLIWFSCCNAVLTSDKFVYLFGRAIPSMALLLSMTLRFVPRFRSQASIVASAQRCIGRAGNQGNLMQRVRNGLQIFSILVTWALENAVDTADSMKSRGYGLKGRTAFSLYRLDQRSIVVLVVLLVESIYVVVGGMLGALKWSFYPALSGMPLSGYSASVYVIFFLLCLLPVGIDLWEERKWTRSRSAI
jgi:energy-coupling factor transport system permease protein